MNEQQKPSAPDAKIAVPAVDLFRGKSQAEQAERAKEKEKQNAPRG